MNKHHAKAFTLLLLVLFIGLTTSVWGAETDNYGNGEYALTRYHVAIEVNEDNSFLITEEIKAHFLVSKHGIIREIPVLNEVVRLDGSSNRIRATLGDLEVNEQYSLERDFSKQSIKIGDPNRTITGDREYRIKYLYSLGRDKNRDFDEFYFNIIGTDWDTTISNITFSIAMPLEFDKNKLGFSAGKKGSTATNKVVHTVKGTTITGSYQGVLQPGEALTVRLELPEGYFLAGSESQIFEIFLHLLPVIFTGIVAYLWFKYGKKEPAVTKVEFYPPPGFNSAEVGLLWKGAAIKKDVISLLIYLANEGYIKIEETVKKGFLRKKESFKIVKVKEYDGKKAHEKKFLEGLFTASIQPNEATLDDLKNRFYLTLDSVVKNLNQQGNLQVFEKNSWLVRFLPPLFIFITLFIFTAMNISFLQYWPIVAAVLTLFSMAGFALMFKTIFGFQSWREKFGAIILGLLIGGFPLFGVLSLASENGLESLASFVWGVFWIGVMLILMKLMPKRTPLGQEMLGKIRGFKRFLQTAEKQRLEVLVQENPTYFYDLLPFTYVLNVSDKWIKKFESIALKPPEWHSRTDHFDNRSFARFINITMSTAQAAMVSHPSSSGGGSSGSSGGGSSGGGSGGGGGTSW